MIFTFVQNIGGTFLLIFLIISLLYIILMIYALVDAIKSEFKDPNMKVIWIIVILFAQLIGTLVYLVLSKSSKKLTY